MRYHTERSLYVVAAYIYIDYSAENAAFSAYYLARERTRQRNIREKGKARRFPLLKTNSKSAISQLWISEGSLIRSAATAAATGQEIGLQYLRNSGCLAFPRAASCHSESKSVFSRGPAPEIPKTRYILFRRVHLQEIQILLLTSVRHY